jgi:phosphoenolpyruvate carboxylase
MQLWQTRLLRSSRLTVAEEIENALSYYDATFLREIPRLYGELEQQLGQQPVASFLRMGNWIGGDRNGTPTSMPTRGMRCAGRARWRCVTTWPKFTCSARSCRYRRCWWA